MLLPSPGWLLMAAALCGAVALTSGADLHSIPPHLLECYSNASVFHRENRLPATIETVVELIRKVERYPDFRMDLRTYTLSLLYMFRLDGVERDYDTVESDFVTPYSPSGLQYYKHLMIVKYLTPTPTYSFPNASLTLTEKCSLHFLMSNSIDDADRGDDSTTCSAIRARRRRRGVADDDDDNALDDDSAPTDDDVAAAAPATDADSAGEDDVDPLADVETVDTGSSEAAPAPPPPPPFAPAAAPASRTSPDVEIINGNTTENGEQKGDMQWARDGDPSVVPRAPSRQASPNVAKSACPVENGVVRTRWGSVQLGTLLAGIAAGLNRETVLLNDLRQKLPARNQDVDSALNGLSVDNLWAATLAGDLAEVALAQGPKSTSGSSISVGAVGNWNNTQAPRWYFINNVNDMTDAEIRGGIDGLIIGTYVSEWYQTMNRQLKLSSLLERYFSTRGIISQDYRACKRQDHFASVAPQEETRQQAFNFAYLLMDQNPKVVSIKREGVETYTNQAVQALIRYVPSDLKEVCEASSSAYSIDKYDEVVPVVDLNFVLDCTWKYNQVESFFEKFATELNLDDADPGSSITIHSGNDFKVLVNTTRNYTGFITNLRKNITEFNSCGAMSLKNLLEKNLREYYTYDLDRQKNETDIRINSKVVVLMPHTSFNPSITESEEIKDLMTEYRTKFPDVKFLIFAQINQENFKNIVEESGDIIIFEGIERITTDALIRRLKEVPRRISNPICGSTWEEKTYGPYSHIDYVGLNQTAFYRINPKYLFGMGSGTIKVREDGTGGTIKVCYSRTQKLPQGEDNNPSNNNGDKKDEDVTCERKNSNELLEIPLDKPCKGQSNFLSCHPLYISINAVASNNQCGESCKNPDDVRVTITHSQLTCGVGAFLANPITLAITVLLSVSKIFFS